MKKVVKKLEAAVTLGSMGGKAKFKKVGRKGMSKMGKNAAEKRWGKK